MTEITTVRHTEQETDNIAVEKRYQGLNGPEDWLNGMAEYLDGNRRFFGDANASYAIMTPNYPPEWSKLEPLEKAFNEAVSEPEVRTKITSAKFASGAAHYLQHNFGVHTDPGTEIVSVNGSAGGQDKLLKVLLDPGDIVLYPSMSYFLYNNLTILNGGTPVAIPMSEKTGFMPDLESIPADILSKAKVLMLNYPHCPTGNKVTLEYWQKIVAFAKQHGLFVINDCDNPLICEGKRTISFLEAEGAKDIGAEVHTVSKTFSIPALRAGFVAGNSTVIKAVSELSERLCEKVPTATQETVADLYVMPGLEKYIKEYKQNLTIKKRFIINWLQKTGWKKNEIWRSDSLFYVWAKVPAFAGEISAREFAAGIFRDTGILFGSGEYFGNDGERYFRLGMTENTMRMEKEFGKVGEYIEKRYWDREMSGFSLPLTLRPHSHI